jgi:hypothetical protein
MRWSGSAASRPAVGCPGKADRCDRFAPPVACAGFLRPVQAIGLSFIATPLAHRCGGGYARNRTRPTPRPQPDGSQVAPVTLAGKYRLADTQRARESGVNRGDSCP